MNVYLPKSLIARVDKRAAELGMSRSSFFGLAASTALGRFPGPLWQTEPRSKVRRTSGPRAERPPTKKPSL